MPKKKWYVVIVGQDIGVYDNWLKVTPLVEGVSGAQYAKFCSEEEAIRAFAEAEVEGHVRRVDSGLEFGNVSTPLHFKRSPIPANRTVSAGTRSVQTNSSNHTMERSPHRDAPLNRAASPQHTPKPSTSVRANKGPRLYPVHVEPSPPESYRTYGIESVEDTPPPLQNVDFIRRRHERSISTGSSYYPPSRKSIASCSSSRAVRPRRSSVGSSNIQHAVVGDLSDVESYPSDSDESSGPEDVTPRRDYCPPGDVLSFMMTGKMSLQPSRHCSPCKRTVRNLDSPGVHGRVCAECGEGYRPTEAILEMSPSRREDPFKFFSQPLHVSSCQYDAVRDPRSPMHKGTKIPGLTLTLSPPFGRPTAAKSRGQPMSLVL